MTWSERFKLFISGKNASGDKTNKTNLKWKGLIGFGFLSIVFPYICSETGLTFGDDIGKIFLYINSITVFVMLFCEIPRLKLQNRYFNVCYYVGTFILCEISVGLLVYLFIKNVPIPEINLWSISIAAISLYPLILSAFSNTLNHLISVYYAIRGSKKPFMKRLTAFRAFQIVVNVTCLCASIFFVFCSLETEPNAFISILEIQVYLAISVICFYSLLSEEGEMQLFVGSNLVDLAYCIRMCCAAQHLFIPALFTVMRIIIAFLHKILTLSKIAMEAEKENQLNMDKNWFYIFICIALLSIGRAIWLNISTVPYSVRSNKEANSSSQKIETDV